MGLITKPLDSLEDLWAWNEATVNTRLVGRELKYNIKRKDVMETLVCHDMAGGYLPEESVSGYMLRDSTKPYVMMHWWYIDIFTYFSHRFVTIPPTGWINQAHNHDVIILGTFITEWEDGAKLCEKFLDNEEVVQRTVKQLVRIAKFYHFEGWLINIENSIKEKCIPLLSLFLHSLTSTMRSEVGENSRVIWYDSVTTRGNLAWQNQLNEENRWFSLTDGIFLNYRWKPKWLLSTKEYAAGRQFQVYAFEQVRKLKLSIALFAPGWIVENFPSGTHLLNSLKYWGRLADFVYAHRLTSLPVETNFSVGFSGAGGNHRFYNLSDAEMQPFYLGSSALPGYTDPCVILPNAGDYRLFQTEISAEGVYKVSFDADIPLELLIWISDDSTDELTNTICKPVDTDGCVHVQLSKCLITGIGVRVSRRATLKRFAFCQADPVSNVA